MRLAGKETMIEPPEEWPRTETETKQPSEASLAAPSGSAWHTTLWLDGRVQRRRDAGASTARHLYKGTVWHGTLTGMTNETEQIILDSLNNEVCREADQATKPRKHDE